MHTITILVADLEEWIRRHIYM